MFALADIHGMETVGWRERLTAAMKERGKSMRALSLEIGAGEGYAHSILKDGKDPSVDNVMKMCAALGVSVTRILYGFDISPETEKLLQAAERRPDRVPHLLAILEEAPSAEE